MSEYGINSISSLTFREGVRSRIQMYLGSDDIEGVYQALKEIINNSTDEALAGHGKKIEITQQHQIIDFLLSARVGDTLYITVERETKNGIETVTVGIPITQSAINEY